MMLVSQGWQVSRGSKIKFISYFNIWLSAFETLRLFKVVNAFWQGFSQQTLKMNKEKSSNDFFGKEYLLPNSL